MVNWSPWSAVELTEARTSGRSGLSGLPRGGDNEEGATGIRFCLLPRLGRRRGGGTPGAKLRLRMAMTQVKQMVGRGELGVWGASPGSGLPFIGAGGDPRGQSAFNGRR
jgi:hypothetical protein